uniref:Uncharacterized protein n=1 Tax=Physcomitrium patens TaxID=3218 RepID=A0A2K1IST2_PHYPA|nr:hypothetical protein PHYPA_026460 [Physcomitrium patens]
MSSVSNLIFMLNFGAEAFSAKLANRIIYSLRYADSPKSNTLQSNSIAMPSSPNWPSRKPVSLPRFAIHREQIQICIGDSGRIDDC